MLHVRKIEFADALSRTKNGHRDVPHVRMGSLGMTGTLSHPIPCRGQYELKRGLTDGPSRTLRSLKADLHQCR